MFSIKNDIKFPNNWKYKKSNYSDQFLMDIFQESIKMGIYDEKKRKESWKYFYGAMELSKYLWSQLNEEQIKIASTQLHLQYIIDDYLDDGDVKDEESIQRIIDIEEIILTGELKYKDRVLDKYVLHYRNLIYNHCKSTNKLNFLEIIFKYFLDWLNSIIPFNKLQENNENNPHFELFKLIRIKNMGMVSQLTISFLFLPNEEDISIWNNLYMLKMLEILSVVSSIINDIFSYSKEKLNNQLLFNYIYIEQQRTNCSFNESYKQILSKFNYYIDLYQINENKLLKSSNWSEEMKFDILQIMDGMKCMVQGYFEFCCKSSRFKCNDSPFIETKINEYSENYKLILNQIIKR